jgi:hypothetical protein
MLLEKIGKFYLSKPLFFFLLMLLPILSGSVYLFSKYAKIKDLEERFYNACKRGRSAIEKKWEKEKFLARYAEPNPYFLDEKIESLIFLTSEISQLEMLIQHPALGDKKLFESRLHFLKSGENRLHFVENEIRSSPTIKETEEKQRHPVQMNGEDIKKLLSQIEDVPIDAYSSIQNRPQMVITDFRLEKKQTPIKTEVFEVEMQCIKREFIK